MINTQEIRDLIGNLFDKDIIYQADEDSIYTIYKPDNIEYTVIIFRDEYSLHNRPKTLDRLQFFVRSPEMISMLLDEIDRLQDYEYKYNSCNK